jgi:flagellin
VSGSFLALSIADAAAEVVNRQRASFGALQSRFDNTVTNLGASVENLSAAKSRILDADFAAETANLTRSQVLQQAGIAVLAQANAVPNNVLALLR